MCGICGALNLGEDKLDLAGLVSKMRDTMVHRGPDDQGLYISRSGNLGLGHRRLSIIDLSPRGKQPMSNEDGTVWIVFNGEIYNYKSLQEKLKERGHTFKSNTDTETIIHLYEDKGIDAVHDLEGMFAFALWDEIKGKLFLVRDRIGIKPIYFTRVNHKLLFGSEIKAILADPQVPRRVNEEAFYHYLSFLTTPAPNTLFEGIKKLPAGSWLEVGSSGLIKEQRYWDVLDHASPLIGVSEAKIAERLLAELRRSVQIRKVSDVPVGVFLSGGIDSTANAFLFSEGESKAVSTFSIGYSGEYESYANEFFYARMAAELVGAKHHEKTINLDDLLSFIPQMVHYQDEPIADPVCVPLYYVSKLARESGVIVCQVGEGSDELFCGYPSWKRALDLEKKSGMLPRFIKRLGLVGLRLAGKEESFQYEWLQRSASGQPIFWGGAEAFTDVEKKKILSARLREKFKDFSSYEAIRPIRERFESKAEEKSHLNWMTYLDLNLRLPELLLMRVDKMSMAASIETRVPFLDYKFVELAMSIPSSIKTKNGTLKYILKKAMRGVIPDEIIDRKKQGFGVPIYEWFFGRLGDEAKEVLTEFCDKTDFLDKNAVMELLDSGKRAQAWYLLNFALWWKEFEVESS
jgi:asparagine synthase (glutamine-hydrolysing)